MSAIAATGTAGTSTMRSMTVAQRPGQTTAIRRDLRRAYIGRPAVVAAESARTRIHRRDEHEASGKHRGARCAGDRDATFLERLPQHLEDPAIELRHLVEEQHAVVRERDLAGPRNRTAADKRDVRDGVMRRAEGTLPTSSPAPAAAFRLRSGSPCTRAPRRTSVAGESSPSRLASIVLPAPGGPVRSRLWPPAAATSSARRANS